MGDPHKHHFIPSFYLAQWANTDGKVIEFTRKHNKLIAKPVGPDYTGFEIDLYEAKDLAPVQRQFLEKVFFNYLDQTAFRALRLHLGTQPQWTNELINAWSRFVFGIHFRHPHTMPELREAAQVIWDASGADKQAEWEKIKESHHPATFDEYLATIDPFTAAKMRVNLLIKVFDNDTLVAHLNRMPYAVIDVSAAPEAFVTSDRPVCINNLGQADGFICLPISPTKLFLAVNEEKSFASVRTMRPLDLVRRVNEFVVGRARLYVWARDRTPEPFINASMSSNLEVPPFFPNAGRYP